jgi:uncharacterized protein YyaL (SSP411 family)
MESGMFRFGSAYSNWLLLWLHESLPLRELVVCGNEAIEKRKHIFEELLPTGIIIAGCIEAENVALTKERLKKGKTLIYFCKDQTCSIPMDSIDDAKAILKN